jgi:glyoxylase-like metal-dependent hydrolase (beta-lactamase superfamily II)
MDNWFTTEPIDEHTWVISEDGHWEQPHSYLLLGDASAVLIDTGLGVASIKNEVARLTGLPVKVIITHAHWDHVGGVAEFSDIAIHEADSKWLADGLPIPDSQIRENFNKTAPRKPFPKTFNIKTYATPKITANEVLKGGEVMDLGNRVLRILHTPGHSPGSICVYDEVRGYLFTGDTLYEGTLYMNYESTDPQAFARSMRILAQLPNVVTIMPGHNKAPLKADILREADKAFAQLETQNLLKHGSGLHKFSRIGILV